MPPSTLLQTAQSLPYLAEGNAVVPSTQATPSTPSKTAGDRLLGSLTSPSTSCSRVNSVRIMQPQVYLKLCI